MIVHVKITWLCGNMGNFSPQPVLLSRSCHVILLHICLILFHIYLCISHIYIYMHIYISTYKYTNLYIYLRHRNTQTQPLTRTRPTQYLISDCITDAARCSATSWFDCMNVHLHAQWHRHRNRHTPAYLYMWQDTASPTRRAACCSATSWFDHMNLTSTYTKTQTPIHTSPTPHLIGTASPTRRAARPPLDLIVWMYTHTHKDTHKDTDTD